MPASLEPAWGVTNSSATGVCRTGGRTYMSGGIMTPAYYYENILGNRAPAYALWFVGTTTIRTLTYSDTRGHPYEASCVAASPEGALYIGGKIMGWSS